MPEEYKGKVTKSSGYTETDPREWTKEETKWVLDLKEKGFSADEIAESIGRTKTSVSIKLKRIKKKNYTYNEKHVDEKYETNNSFLEHVNPSSVLDVYAGQKSWYEGKCNCVVSNDKSPEAKTTFHLDALKFVCNQYYQGNKFDVVDLDPFGSAYDCFDLSIKMAKKGIVITFGEVGHKRWKRLDFVKRYYGIERIEDFKLDKLIQEVQKIGIRNKKELVVFEKKEWQNIARVWFEIKPMKITEQWEKL